MKFARLDLLWVLIPLIASVLAVRWRRPRSYFTHPLLRYLKTRIRPASRLVYLPRFLELAVIGIAGRGAPGPGAPSVATSHR